MAVAQFNPHSLIAARVLSRNQDATIDTAFLQRRLARALRLRERLYDEPFYRLVHAEADGLPGLVIDRFGKGLRGAPRDAVIARVVEPERRGLAFGLHRSMDHAGAPIGPAAAAGIASSGKTRWPSEFV